MWHFGRSLVHYGRRTMGLHSEDGSRPHGSGKRGRQAGDRPVAGSGLVIAEATGSPRGRRPVRELLAAHVGLLEASAISDDVARARDYFTATTRTQLADLGSRRYQRLVPALVLPVWAVKGRIVN